MMCTSNGKMENHWIRCCKAVRNASFHLPRLCRNIRKAKLFELPPHLLDSILNNKWGLYYDKKEAKQEIYTEMEAEREYDIAHERSQKWERLGCLIWV